MRALHTVVAGATRDKRHRGPNGGPQSNGRRKVSGGSHSRSNNQGNHLARQGSSVGTTHADNLTTVPTQLPAPPSAPGPALAAAPTMRYDATFTGYTNLNARQHGTSQVKPAPTP